MEIFNGILLCFWPVWVGVFFAVIVSQGIKFDALVCLSRKQIILMGAVLGFIVTVLSFLWFLYVSVELQITLTYMGSHGSMAPVGFEEKHQDIRQELWLRMVMPPTGKDCFSTQEICEWADGVMEQEGDGEYYADSTILEWFIGNFLFYALFCLPVGLGMSWLLNRLIKYRLSRHLAAPT